MNPNSIMDSSIRKSEFRIGFLGVEKKPFLNDNANFPVYGFFANFSYLLGRMSAFVCGIEFVNDYSLKEKLKRDNQVQKDHRRVGVLAGHEFKIGRFRFSQQLGYYIYAPVKAMDPVYQRWEILFLPINYVYVGFGLKSHRHEADFLDFRLGVIPITK